MNSYQKGLVSFSCPQLVRLAMSRELLPRDTWERAAPPVPLSPAVVLLGRVGPGRGERAGVCLCRLQRNTLTRFMFVNNGLDLFTDRSNHFRLVPGF